jgi:hypothetical protein
MKYIIAGSRTIRNYSFIKRKLDTFNNITEIVSGDAPGPDRAGARYARQCGIKCTVMKAQWKRHGKSAGPIRNEKMANYADRLVAFWDGKSKGTEHMIKYAKSIGMYVVVFTLNE